MDAGFQLMSGYLPALFEVALKGTLLLASAMIASALMRRRSAAARHMVWTIAMAGLLALPVISLLLPQMHILPEYVPVAIKSQEITEPQSPDETPPQSSAAIPDDAPPRVEVYPAPDTFASRVDLSAGAATSRPISDTSAMAASSEIVPEAVVHDDGEIGESAGLSAGYWREALAAIWILGVLIALSPIAAGRIILARMSRRAVRVEGGPLLEIYRECCRAMGMSGRAVLLVSDRPVMPMAWGIFRGRIMLPSGFGDWPEERKRAALLHEIAHLRRRDALIQLLSGLAFSLHWFNPLAWLARRRLKIERERACDDAVINSGFRPSDYAQELVVAVSGLLSGACETAAVSMARRSGLEGRVGAILDASRSRIVTRRFKTLFLSAAAAAIILIACIAGPFAERRAALAQENAPAENIVRPIEEQEAVADRADVVVRFDFPEGVEAPEEGRLWLFSRPFGEGIDYRLFPGYEFSASSPENRSVELPWGRVSAYAYAEGFAPALVGPFDHTPDAPLKNIDLEMRPGGVSELILSAEDGGAPDNFRMELSLEAINDRIIRPGGGIPIRRISSSDIRHDRSIIMRDLPESAIVSISVTADGFEHNTFHNISIKPGERVEIKLKRSVPATGLIVDAEGNPIADARILLIGFNWGGPEILPVGYSPLGSFSNVPVSQWAVSDPDGRFSINRMRGPGWRYWFFVGGSDRHEPAVIGPIQSGEDLNEIRLGTSISLKVRATAPGDPDNTPNNIKILQGYHPDISIRHSLYAPANRTMIPDGMEYSVTSGHGLRRGPVTVEVYFGRSVSSQNTEVIEREEAGGTVRRFIDRATGRVIRIEYTTELRNPETTLEITPEEVRRNPGLPERNINEEREIAPGEERLNPPA